MPLQKPAKGPQPEKRYINREGYGKVPAYLSEVKQQIQVEKEYIAAALAERKNQTTAPGASAGHSDAMTRRPQGFTTPNHIHTIIADRYID